MTEFNFWAYLLCLMLGIAAVFKPLPKKELPLWAQYIQLSILIALLIMLVKYR